MSDFTFTFFGDSGSRVTVSGPSWVVCRQEAMRLLPPSADGSINFIPATWDKPTVELRYIGSDATRSGGRRLQRREKSGKSWSEWMDAN